MSGRVPERSRASAIGAEALAGRRVAETADGPVLVNHEWDAVDLVAGITTAGAGDYGVSLNGVDALLEAYGSLARRLGFRTVAVPRQVHGTEVLRVTGSDPGKVPVPGAPPSVLLAGRVDGLVTSTRDLLLVSTAADCVPVYLKDGGGAAIGLVHAGWRGVAGGILANAVDAMEVAGARRDDVRIHLGPAICGPCYEVDRPVLSALGLEGERAHVDLRGVLVDQARSAGVGTVTVSAHCTRCGDSDLHSHRGSDGQAGRMAAFIGRRRA